MKNIRYVTIFFAAFLGSMIGMIMLIPFGLLVGESIILPITMLVAALPVALAASWVGNAFHLQGQRTQLKAVVLSVEKTAVFLAIFQFLNVTFEMVWQPQPSLKGIIDRLTMPILMPMVYGEE